ncbi:PTS lactose/cellobiose transporter subunit IIA [Bombilactobacillus bombi]|uniref:PTS lactose/cellobiose transporter subunit IIA n=1 Tax=Bombilactobacillus bombi TaxID=1303590 RepID=A0A3R6VJ77_9LACO|nr:PTS lactose/cellobiose transporter subunit IIA [Bombilactobacillus bombi]RHW50031.1 PTS lactose/cellobiose transporter subunit IIA [Bombilactobacillus bombi]
MDDEQVVMQLISLGGSARSASIEAIREARKQNFGESSNLMKQAKEELTNAHNVQTKMLQNEVNGNTKETTLLMVHAQDHLMNAMTVNDLAKEIIDNLKEGSN